MGSKLTLKVFCVLAACWSLGLAADDEEMMPGEEVTEPVVTENGDITNETITWCNTEQKDKCECSKDSASEDAGSSKPENACVKINIAMGHARYSALTKSIMLQLNELVPNSALYSPSGFKVVAGFAVNSVSRVKNVSGVSKYVTLTSSAGVPVTFEFADGASVGMPLMTTDSLADGRLVMADAQGWATAADPAYYDYYPGDGARWRFGAAPLSPDYMQFVEHRTPEGRVETRQDLGLEIVRNAEGGLRQVATPAWVADFLVTGQDAYDLKIYPNDASCVAGTRTAEGLFAFVQGAEPDVVWEFRNPRPGVMRDLQVTKKIGVVSETWFYKYVEDVQDFTLVYPLNAKQIRLEKYNSDNGKSRVVRRSVLGCDGKAFSTQEKCFDVSASRSRLTKSVRDPGGLNLTRTYSYYSDGVLEGLPSVNVGEDGAWARYEYDDQRRTTAEIRPWLDAPTNAPVNQCAVTRFGYEFVDTSDFLRGGDKRPRTVIEEICGIEVARTYHAYPTNVVGQSQEIVERAAFRGAPYGHASNQRTVKTYFAPSAVAALAGRLSTVTYPGGKVEQYGYEYGAFNAAEFAFAPDPGGGAWRETVTTSYGANSGVQVLRVSRVWDEKGREVLDESYVEDGAAFARIGWKRLSYNLNGKLVETVYSDGRVESATWGANCCGKESETSTEGIITVYGYNELKQKVSETKKGFAANGADDITTLYAYDLENRILFSVVTNSASGLGYMASRSAYDAVGRATNMVDRLGNATFTDYDTLVTTVLRPNGVTAVTERYLDGRPKRVLENGVVKNAYAYGVNPDGASWTLSARGPLPAAIQLTLELPNFSMLELLDFPWLLQATDPLGRNIATYKPGFGGTVLVSSNAYDIAGSLLFTTQYSSQLLNLNSSILNAPTLYSYAADGSLFLTALDLNTNGVIDLSGPDRITGSSTVYDKDTSNVWWLVSRSWVYPEFGSSASVTTSVERVMLTGLSAARGDGYVLTALSRSLDVRGNATTSCTFIDRTARRVTHATTSPVSVQSAIQFSVNGLEVSNISATAVATAYAYDALGRRTLSETVSGERRVALLTQYNSHGQIEYTEDAASNRTSYAYDALGRRTAVIDALSNTVYTAYDTDDHVIALWGATYPVSYGYDTLGNMVEMGTYRGATEITDYAGFLSLISKFDKTSWLYEQPTGLLTNKLFVDDAGPTYTYTTDGKLASRKWARNIETSYTYDNTGAMVKIDYSDTTPDIIYSNDRLGNICFVSDDDSGSHTLSHDPDGLLLMDVVQFKNKVFSFCEFYDVFGRSAGYTISNSVDNVSSFITGTVLNYGSLGRIREIAVQGKSIPFRYSWLPGSDLQATLTMPNGVTRETVFEPYRDLPSSITHTNAEGTILVQRLLTYDEIGHLKNRIQFRACEAVNRFDSFTYNDRSELTHASLGTNAFSYAFDCIGNRQSAAEPKLTANYFSNSLNQYTNIAYGNAPLFTPLYDADGNQTLIQTASGIWLVTYNAENRPVVFSNETTVVEMSYDYLGRRCEYKEKIEGMLIRHERYLYRDRVQVAAIDLLDATSSQSRLIYGLIWDPTDPVATHPLASIEPSSMNSENMIWHYYNIDQVKNVTEIFDDSSDVALTYDYTPFGIVISNMYAHGDINTPPVAFNPLTFASEVQDATIGLQYFNFRHYNPFDGRWINRDPLEDVAFYARRNLKFYETMALSRSRNKGEMLYCDNEVMSSVDYLGLSCDKGCSKTDFTTSLSWGETIPGIGISVKIQGSRTTQESTCGIECKDCSCGKEIKKKDSWTFGEAFSVPVRVYGVRIGEIGVDGGGTGFTEDNYNSCTGLRTSDKVLGIYINVSGGPCVFVSSYAKWCVKCSLAYKYQYSSYTSRSYSGWSGGCYFESCLGPVCKKVPLGKGHTR